MRQLVRQLAVISHKQEPGRIFIKAANRFEQVELWWQQVVDSLIALPVSRYYVTDWFVKHDCGRLGRLIQRLAIKSYSIGICYLLACGWRQFVYTHSPFINRIIGRTPG